jgi:hypothetical protein
MIKAELIKENERLNRQHTLLGKLKAESDLSSAIRGRDYLKKENSDLKKQLREMYFKESK